MSLISLGATALKWLGKAIAGPVWMARAIAAATLSVAQACLKLVDASIVPDLGRAKEALLDSMEAEAAKRVAEAAEAANRAALPKAKRRRIEAEAEKLKAEAHAIRKDADSRAVEARTREKEIEAGLETLQGAISRLRQEGGEIFFSRENLKQIISTPLPPEDTSGELHRLLSLPFPTEEMSVRTRKTLERVGVKTVRDVVQMTEAELRKIRGFGETSLREVKGRLAEMGLPLGMSLPEEE